MDKLHKAAQYLINHFETYEEMREVENEINKDYFVPIIEKISDQISSHESLPAKWEIEAPSNSDEEEAAIIAYPASWKKWNKWDEELGHVKFCNLTLSELLAKNRDDKSWFAFTIPLSNRRDDISINSTQYLKKISSNYIELLEGYELTDSGDTDSCFSKLIDKMPVHMIESEKSLINFVVTNLLKIIKVVDTLNTEHSKELLKLKKANK